MPVRVSVALVAGLLILASPREARACSCVGGTPLCEEFWQTAVVFSGQVLSADDSSSPGGLLQSRVVRFRVDRTWRGDLAAEIDVYTGSGGGDCGYPFMVGGQYLVYASAQEGRLSTGICTRTKLLAGAQEDLEYFEAGFRPEASGRIFGRAQYERGTRDVPPRPVRGYTVILSDGRQEWTTTTDAEGRYAFTGMPAGRYTVRLEVPAAEHVYGRATFELPDPRACANADFTVAVKPD